MIDRKRLSGRRAKPSPPAGSGNPKKGKESARKSAHAPETPSPPAPEEKGAERSGSTAGGQGAQPKASTHTDSLAGPPPEAALGKALSWPWRFTMGLAAAATVVGILVLAIYILEMFRLD